MGDRSTLGCGDANLLDAASAFLRVGEIRSIVLAYDATRLARNCADWYSLLDTCGHRDACWATTRASMIRPRSTGGCCWASRARSPRWNCTPLRDHLNAGLVKAKR